jgi:hypothetical protein
MAHVPQLTNKDGNIGYSSSSTNVPGYSSSSANVPGLTNKDGNVGFSSNQGH